MLKYLPFIVVGVVIIPLTVMQWRLMDWVWGNNTQALQCAYLMKTEIPLEFGDWVGEDKAVSAEILEVAGADGYIDRTYTNKVTHEQVSIWLIVGHFRQVVRHTPNVCYEASGYKQVEQQSRYGFDVSGQRESRFYTAKFHLQQGSQEHFQRVFWAWWKPDKLEEGQSAGDVKIAWSAPEEPRVDFGGSRALYKLYFTAASDADQSPGESVCVRFASEFLPIVNKSLTESGIVMQNEELPADLNEVLHTPESKAADPPETAAEDPLYTEAEESTESDEDPIVVD